MEMQVLAPTGDATKVQFKDLDLNATFVVSLSGSLAKQWNLANEEDIIKSVIKLAEEIFSDHDSAKPYHSEYSFTTENSELTLTKTIERIQHNPGEY